ncbi:MAG: hypothetical protein H6Q99_307 [Proteobacteria bacterium]|nr:hypothetical protein [Pseudomonadota bacterium]
MADKILPCPFCGGLAEQIELTDEENAGGSVICCTKCHASSSVHFGRKENLVSIWNERTWVSSRQLEDGEHSSDAPADIPEDVWEAAYDEADAFSPVYGCDEKIRFGLTEAFARAILAERKRCAVTAREVIPDGEPLSRQRIAHRAATLVANAIEGKDHG